MNDGNTNIESQPIQKRKMNGCLIAILVAAGLGILTVGGCLFLGGAAISGMAKQKADQLKALENAPSSELSPTGELAAMFNLMSKHTDLQRDNKEKEIKGKVVEWTLALYEVHKLGDDYKIQTKTNLNGVSQFTGVREEVAAFVVTTPRNKNDQAFIEALKGGDRFRFKGYIDGITMRLLQIQPAILIDSDVAQNNATPTTNEVPVLPKPTPPPTPAPTVQPSHQPPSTQAQVAEVPDQMETQKAKQTIELELLALQKEQLKLQVEKLTSEKNALEQSPTQSPAAPAPTPPPTAGIVPVMPGERFPETRLQLIGPADLMNLNLNDLRYAINEMYARHGASFKNQEITRSFTSKEWYKPRAGVSLQQIEQEFSQVETDNLRLLGKERTNKEASADLHELIDAESNLREGPGLDYPVVRKSRKGEVGEALSNKNGWMKLQFADGSMAWAHEQNLKATTQQRR